MNDDSSPYKLVESLYGPGTVGAWILTTLSVIITWTLNTRSRRKDSLSLDFIAVLLLPAISAAHLVYQVVRLKAPVAQILTSPKPEDIQIVAAFEAPLNICETFSLKSLILALICLRVESKRIRWKRLGSVLAVGLLSWATETILFAATFKGVKVSDTMLSRPYAFLFAPLVAYAWTFLLICAVLSLGVWLVSAIRKRRKDERTNGAVQGNVRRNTLELQSYISGGRTDLSPDAMRDLMERMTEDNIAMSRAIKQDSLQMKLLAATTMLFLPGTFVATLFSLSFSTDMQLVSNDHVQRATLFFLPKSGQPIASLDQSLTLATGGLVFAHSVWSAYNSRCIVEQTEEHVVARRRSI